MPMNQSMPPTARIAALTAGTLALSLGTGASAQYELGDGRALDNNLQVGSGGINPRGRDFAAEVAFRNAVVTGNVGRGMSFRGDIDYTAPFDFRSEIGPGGAQIDGLGSNDLYSYVRDSAYSGLAVRNLRGMDSLRYQLDTTTANQTRGFGGDFIIRRAGTGADAAQVGKAAPSSVIETGLDPFRLVSGSLRSTGAFESKMTIDPDILAYGRRQGEEVLMVASELQGIRSLPSGSDLFTPAEPTALDPFSLTPELPEPPVTGMEDQPADAEAPEVTGDLVTSRVQAQVTTRQRLLEELSMRAEKVEGLIRPTPATPKPPVDGEAEEQPFETPEGDSYEALIQRLQTNIEEFLPSPEDQAPAEGEVQDDEAPAGPPGRPQLELLPDHVREMLGKDPIVVDKLFDENISTEQLYKRHMQAGEAALEAGRWFEAEERFTAAITIESGEPLAAIGRINAQIGAGMYRSAAINLRNLYQAYPELIGVRFTENLLPRGARLERIRTQVRDRFERPSDFGRDASLILAYLGWQYEQQQDINDGIDSIFNIDRELGAESLAVHRLLREVWTTPSEDE